MSTKATTLIVLSLVAIALVAGVVLWRQLPDQMASHWNANDEVDGYMSKSKGVFLTRRSSRLECFGLFWLPSMDPLKANIAEFRGTFNLFIVFISVFMSYIHALTLAWTRLPEFQMSAANAAPPRRVIHLYWVYAQAGKTQLLSDRHPDDGTPQAIKLGQDASPRARSCSWRREFYPSSEVCLAEQPPSG